MPSGAATAPQHGSCARNGAGSRAGDVGDPRYRRLRYIRYADDHLLGFTGPKAEAEQIKQRLAAFLRDDLKLELSEGKTLITHARTQAASFPGYEITVQHSHDRPMVNGVARLRVPQAVAKAKCAPYLSHGKPERRAAAAHRRGGKPGPAGQQLVSVWLEPAVAPGQGGWHGRGAGDPVYVR